MRWGQLDLLWIAAGPLVVLALFGFASWRRRKIVENLGEHPLISQLLETFSMERRIIKRFCLFFGFVLITVAALRPQYGQKQSVVRRAGIDVAVAFDISKSMLARDVVPSRLISARTALKSILAQVKGDRIALVPFAGIAFIQSPLTGDQRAIEMYLDELDPKAMPVGGTNLAEAISRSTALLTGQKDKGDRGERSRVILLITDGEDNNPDRSKAALKAAEEAREAGIFIYAMAVGTAVGEPIPILGSDGTHQGYVKDNAGQTVVSKLNLELLEKLTDANLGDGSQRVIRFEGDQSSADAVSASFKSLQQSALEMAMRNRYNEQYQYFLVPAFLLLLAEVLISERKRRSGHA